MQEFSKNRSTRFTARRPVLVAACAVFLVGGGAFAAAGGIDLIKSLFVTVEINGQPVQIELQPVGENSYEGSLETQTADGQQANIRVKRVEDGPNQLKTHVNVNVSGDGTVVRNEGEFAIGKGVHIGSDSDDAYTMADLGDAVPVHEWTNAQDQARALYLIDGDDFLRIFSVTTPADGEAIVRRLAQLPASAGFDGDPEVAVDDNDAITLTWNGESGDQQERRVIKLIDKHSSNPADLSMPLSVDTPAGEIKVKIDAQDARDEQ